MSLNQQENGESDGARKVVQNKFEEIQLNETVSKRKEDEGSERVEDLTFQKPLKVESRNPSSRGSEITYSFSEGGKSNSIRGKLFLPGSRDIDHCALTPQDQVRRLREFVEFNELNDRMSSGYRTADRNKRFCSPFFSCTKRCIDKRSSSTKTLPDPSPTESESESSFLDGEIESDFSTYPMIRRSESKGTKKASLYKRGIRKAFTTMCMTFKGIRSFLCCIKDIASWIATMSAFLLVILALYWIVVLNGKFASKLVKFNTEVSKEFPKVSILLPNTMSGSKIEEDDLNSESSSIISELTTGTTSKISHGFHIRKLMSEAQNSPKRENQKKSDQNQRKAPVTYNSDKLHYYSEGSTIASVKASNKRGRASDRPEATKSAKMGSKLENPTGSIKPAKTEDFITWVIAKFKGYFLGQNTAELNSRSIVNKIYDLRSNWEKENKLRDSGIIDKRSHLNNGYSKERDSNIFSRKGRKTRDIKTSDEGKYERCSENSIVCDTGIDFDEFKRIEQTAKSVKSVCFKMSYQCQLDLIINLYTYSEIRCAEEVLSGYRFRVGKPLDNIDWKERKLILDRRMQYDVVSILNDIINVNLQNDALLLDSLNYCRSCTESKTLSSSKSKLIVESIKTNAYVKQNSIIGWSCLPPKGSGSGGFKIAPYNTIAKDRLKVERKLIFGQTALNNESYYNPAIDYPQNSQTSPSMTEVIQTTPFTIDESHTEEMSTLIPATPSNNLDENREQTEVVETRKRASESLETRNDGPLQDGSDNGDREADLQNPKNHNDNRNSNNKIRYNKINLLKYGATLISDISESGRVAHKRVLIELKPIKGTYIWFYDSIPVHDRTNFKSIREIEEYAEKRNLKLKNPRDLIGKKYNQNSPFTRSEGSPTLNPTPSVDTIRRKRSLSEGSRLLGNAFKRILIGDFLSPEYNNNKTLKPQIRKRRQISPKKEARLWIQVEKCTETGISCNYSYLPGEQACGDALISESHPAYVTIHEEESKSIIKFEARILLMDIVPGKMDCEKTLVKKFTTEAIHLPISEKRCRVGDRFHQSICVETGELLKQMSNQYHICLPEGIIKKGKHDSEVQSGCFNFFFYKCTKSCLLKRPTSDKMLLAKLTDDLSSGKLCEFEILPSKDKETILVSVKRAFGPVLVTNKIYSKKEDCKQDCVFRVPSSVTNILQCEDGGSKEIKALYSGLSQTVFKTCDRDSRTVEEYRSCVGVPDDSLRIAIMWWALIGLPSVFLFLYVLFNAARAYRRMKDIFVDRKERTCEICKMELFTKEESDVHDSKCNECICIGCGREFFSKDNNGVSVGQDLKGLEQHHNTCYQFEKRKNSSKRTAHKFLRRMDTASSGKILAVNLLSSVGIYLLILIILAIVGLAKSDTNTNQAQQAEAPDTTNLPSISTNTESLEIESHLSKMKFTFNSYSKLEDSEVNKENLPELFHIGNSREDHKSFKGIEDSVEPDQLIQMSNSDEDDLSTIIEDHIYGKEMEHGEVPDTNVNILLKAVSTSLMTSLSIISFCLLICSLFINYLKYLLMRLIKCINSDGLKFSVSQIITSHCSSTFYQGSTRLDNLIGKAANQVETIVIQPSDNIEPAEVKNFMSFSPVFPWFTKLVKRIDNNFFSVILVILLTISTIAPFKMTLHHPIEKKGEGLSVLRSVKRLNKCLGSGIKDSSTMSFHNKILMNTILENAEIDTKVEEFIRLKGEEETGCRLFSSIKKVCSCMLITETVHKTIQKEMCKTIQNQAIIKGADGKNGSLKLDSLVCISIINGESHLVCRVNPSINEICSSSKEKELILGLTRAQIRGIVINIALMLINCLCLLYILVEVSLSILGLIEKSSKSLIRIVADKLLIPPLKFKIFLKKGLFCEKFGPTRLDPEGRKKRFLSKNWDEQINPQNTANGCHKLERGEEWICNGCNNVVTVFKKHTNSDDLLNVKDCDSEVDMDDGVEYILGQYRTKKSGFTYGIARNYKNYSTNTKEDISKCDKLDNNRQSNANKEAADPWWCKSNSKDSSTKHQDQPHSDEVIYIKDDVREMSGNLEYNPNEQSRFGNFFRYDISNSKSREYVLRPIKICRVLLAIIILSYCTGLSSAYPEYDYAKVDIDETDAISYGMRKSDVFYAITKECETECFTDSTLDCKCNNFGNADEETLNDVSPSITHLLKDGEPKTLKISYKNDEVEINKEDILRMEDDNINFQRDEEFLGKMKNIDHLYNFSATFGDMSHLPSYFVKPTLPDHSTSNAQSKITITSSSKEDDNILINGYILSDFDLEKGNYGAWEITDDNSDEKKTLVLGVADHVQIYDFDIKYWITDRMFKTSSHWECDTCVNGEKNSYAGAKGSKNVMPKVGYFTCTFGHCAGAFSFGCLTCMVEPIIKTTGWMAAIAQVTFVGTQTALCYSFGDKASSCRSVSRSQTIEGDHITFSSVTPNDDTILRKNVLLVYYPGEEPSLALPDTIWVGEPACGMDQCILGTFGDTVVQSIIKRSGTEKKGYSLDDIMYSPASWIKSRKECKSGGYECIFYEPTTKVEDSAFNMNLSFAHLHSEYEMRHFKFSKGKNGKFNSGQMVLSPRIPHGSINFKVSFKDIKLKEKILDRPLSIRDLTIVSCSGCRSCTDGFECKMTAVLDSPSVYNFHFKATDDLVSLSVESKILHSGFNEFTIAGYTAEPIDEITISTDEVGLKDQLVSSKKIKLEDPKDYIITNRTISGISPDSATRKGDTKECAGFSGFFRCIGKRVGYFFTGLWGYVTWIFGSIIRVIILVLVIFIVVVLLMFLISCFNLMSIGARPSSAASEAMYATMRFRPIRQNKNQDKKDDDYFKPMVISNNQNANEKKSDILYDDGKFVVNYEGDAVRSDMSTETLSKEESQNLFFSKRDKNRRKLKSSDGPIKSNVVMFNSGKRGNTVGKKV